MGCASLGNLYAAMPDWQARETVDAAWEAGLRFFDTAPLYGLGLSERRLGDALRERPRGEFTLSTKVGRLLDPDAISDVTRDRHGFITPMPFAVRFDYTYDGVMRSFEDSLQRLGLARIDLLLVHDIGVETHGGDAGRHMADLRNDGYRALDELRRAAVVSAIGLGVNEWRVCEDAMSFGQWDTFLLAGRYTLLEQEPVRSFLPKCADHGARIILGGAYNSGILATGTRGAQMGNYNYAPPPAAIIERTRQFEQVCDEYGVALAAAALQFPLAHPVVKRVIPGLASADQVRATMELVDSPIPAAFWAELRSQNLILDEAPVPAGR